MSAASYKIHAFARGFLKNRYLVLTTVILTGLVLSYVLYLRSTETQEEGLAKEFDARAKERISSFQTQFSLNLEKVESIAALYEHDANGIVTRDEFCRFTQTILANHPCIQALEWIPRVNDRQRQAYEAVAQKDGFADFHITQRDSNSQIQIASRRDEYFPVYFIEPCKGNEAAVGFDLASNPTRLETLLKARDTGQMAATARIKLVQEKGNQFGFLVLKPVYNRFAPHDTPEQKRQSLKGFVLGVFHISDMFEKSVSDMDPAGFDQYLFDESALSDQRFLYFHSSRTRKSPIQPLTYEETVNAPGLKHLTRFDVCGRKWLAATRPAPAFFEAEKTSQPLQTLLTGIFLTGLIAGYIAFIQNRTAKIWQINVELLQSQKLLESNIIELKKAEEEIRSAKEDWEKTFNAMSDAVTIHDSDFNIVRANKAAETLLGLSAQELLSKKCYQVYHNKGCPPKDCASCMAVRAGMPAATEFYEPALNRHIELKAFPRFDDKNNLMSIVHIVTDITIRKQTEEKIAHLASFPILNPLPVVEADMTGRVSFINPAAEQLFPELRQNGNAHPWLADLETMIRMFQDSGVRSYTRELTVADRCYQQMISYMKESQSIRIYGVDFTERKRAEEELSKSRSMLTNVLNSVPQSVFWKDRNSVYLGCNEICAKAAGLDSPEKIIGKNDFDLAWRDLADAYRADDSEVLENNRSKRHIIETVRQADGTVFWVDTTKVPLVDETGNVYGVLGVFEDISERKIAEETLQKTNEQLKEQDRLKRELIDTVSHELRTPLCIFKNIISNAIAGAMGEISPKLSENLATADKEIKRLATIISDFVDISQIDAGMIELRIKQFAIQSAVGKAIKSLVPLAESKNIQLTVVAPETELLLDADLTRTVQILTHLIDNAVKFTSENGQITVRVKDLDNEIGIDVEDTGIGIADDDISKVFNRFVQIEKIAGPGQHGAGLGLSIAKSLIEMHGGRIWAESTIGRGSNFCFVLPKFPQPLAAVEPMYYEISQNS